MCNSKCGGCVPAMIGKILLIVGGINWGLVGAGMLSGGSGNNLNVVHMLFASVPALEGVVYVLVGVCAVLVAVKCAKKCADGSCSSGECSSSGKSSGCCK